MIFKNFNTVRYSDAPPIERSELVRIRKVLNLVGTKKYVLDLGCRDGSISQLIKENGNNVYGLEASDNAAQLAQEKGISVTKLNLEEEEWPDFGLKFDVVFAGEIIEHIFDTDKFLQNIYKSLKDSGSLVLTTPNLAALGRRILLLFGMNPLIELRAGQYDSGHIRYFTKGALIRLLRENGFLVTEIQSDVLNFTISGKYYTKFIPKVFPTLGRTLMVKAVKKDFV